VKSRLASSFASIVCLTLISAGAQADTSGQQLAEGAGRALLGTPAPRLEVKTIDGRTIDLGQLYGKQAVYLKFWATWCVPCRQQMPHFEHVYESAGPDLAVIAVNVGFNDAVDDIRAYREKLGITMPIVLDDGRLGAAFHLRVTPQHIVIGRDGRIEYVGHLADASLDAALSAARTEPAADASDAGAASKNPAAIVRYAVGDALPELTPLTIEGTPFDFRERGAAHQTVLVFLSPWCESYLATTRPEVSTNCRRMREQVAALAGDHDTRWLGIASGLWATAEDLREYRTQYAVGIPLALDESGALFRAFTVNQLPAALIVDRHGRIVRRVEGAELETPTALRAAIGTR
jgi:peroxiredoxin